MYNILIVDDEKIIRDGIADIISQVGGFNIFTSRNGKEALNIILNQKIHGMILDIKMPHMGGIELMKKLREYEKEEILTIILSGYDDFKYAQQAINYGAIDYILKPVIPSDLIEICKKLRKKLDVQNKKQKELENLKRQVAESKSIIKERLFYDILKGNINKHDYQEKANFLGLNYFGDIFRIVLLEVEEDHKFCDSFETEEDYQVIIKSVENFLEYKVREIEKCNLFHLNTDIFVLMFNYVDVNESYSHELYSLLNDIKSTILSDKGLDVTIGIGNYCKGVENIKQSYYQALNALRYKVLMGKGNIYSIQDFERVRNDLTVYVDIEEVNIQLKTEQKDKIVQSIKNSFSSLRTAEEKPDIFTLYLLCTKYLTALLSVLEEYSINIRELFDNNINFFFEFINKNSIDKIQDWLLKIVDKVVQCLKEYRKHKDISIVEDIKNYIKKNYNKEISNKVIGSQFGFSSNYIGQVFKNETGMTINEYLNKTRIGEAKRLLKDTQLRVFEIAYEVGFNDHQYFSSVFKKIVGITPKEYREL